MDSSGIYIICHMLQHTNSFSFALLEASPWYQLQYTTGSVLQPLIAYFQKKTITCHFLSVLEQYSDLDIHVKNNTFCNSSPFKSCLNFKRWQNLFFQNREPKVAGGGGINIKLKQLVGCQLLSINTITKSLGILLIFIIQGFNRKQQQPHEPI